VGLNLGRPISNQLYRSRFGEELLIQGFLVEVGKKGVRICKTHCAKWMENKKGLSVGN
jgi:hypothetical protein